MSYWDKILYKYEWQSVRDSLAHADTIKVESVRKLVGHIEALEDILDKGSPNWREQAGID